MNQRITTLKNGLRVITAEMKEARSVTACVVVGVGSRHENFSVNGGVSHFLEHLLFKGTTKRPSTKIISEEVDAVGGYSNAYTSNDVTNYYIRVPRKHAALAVDILCDMIVDPLLDPEEVDRERPVIIQEMNVYRDDPARYVGELMPPLYWPNHPMGKEVIGSEEVIMNVPRDAVAEYKARHYSPDNMVVAVAGRVDHNEIVRQVRKLMGGLVPTRVPAPAQVGPKIAVQPAAVLPKETAQAHFIIGCRAYPYRHANDPAAKLITNILGRGLSSRLFLNVREHKGLAYSVYASLHNFVDTGAFEAYAGVDLDKLDLAIGAVMEELMRIQTELVSAPELEKAKNQFRGSVEMAMEQNNNVAERIGVELNLLGKVQSVEDAIEEIDAVTAEQVMAVAKQMLAPANLRLGIIAPAKECRAAEKVFAELIKSVA